jgi:hypothetical protein
MARQDHVYQDLSDTIDVIVVFENHTMRPVRFRWKDQTHKIARVTGAWKSREGEHAVRHFAVVDTRANFFQLTYNERLTKWIISKIWVE